MKRFSAGGMMFTTFNAETANDLWGQLVETFQRGESQTQASRYGNTQEILHAAISLSAPRERWMSSRLPALNPAFAIAEVIWILSGRNDSAPINYFNSQYAKYAGYGPTYHGAYGHRLRRHKGIDQLDRAFRALKADPESRQVVLEIWDGAVDLPRDSGKPADTDIPCNIVSLLKIRSGRLEWTQIIRSNDLFLGLPHNLIQFTSLQEVVAGWLGIDVACYHQISDSLHVYEHDANSIQSVPAGTNEKNTDDLRLPKNESDRVFQELSSQMDLVISSEASADNLLKVAESSGLPTAYRNMLCVLCAEGARRRARVETAQAIMQTCNNPLFVRLFDRWCQRIVEP